MAKDGIMELNISLKRIVANATFVVLSMNIVLVVGSWVLAAVCPGISLRTILGNDGLRWLFGSYVSNICSPVLVWLVLAGVSIGAVSDSRLAHAVCNLRQTTYYERMALLVVLWEIICIAAVIVVLAFVPHAILLSALGTYLPSSFSASIVPVLAVSSCLSAVTYGSITSSFHSVSDVFDSLSRGIGLVAPYIILYIVMTEFYYSLRWVMML